LENLLVPILKPNQRKKKAKTKESNDPKEKKTKKNKAEDIDEPKRNRKKKSNKEDKVIEELLRNNDSVLADVNIKDIVNFDTFDNLLTPEEKDSLLSLLPSVDKISRSSVEQFFRFNDQFTKSVSIYQQLLMSGSLEDSDHYAYFLKGKEPPLDPVQPWKAKLYEEYWGQKKQVSEEKSKKTSDSFSFVQESQNIVSDIPQDKKIVCQQSIKPLSSKRIFRGTNQHNELDVDYAPKRLKKPKQSKKRKSNKKDEVTRRQTRSSCRIQT